jgi:poly-gamma-glutamate capsule biosynthesis protein CapA/YwtB (metallophosphatase superfamily)
MFHSSLDRSCWNGAVYDFSGVFKNVQATIQQADFAIANLEAPVMDPKKALAGDYRFAAPPQAITDYAAAGFDVFTTANNHATDQGTKGFINTIETIKAAGLKTTGTWRSAEERAEICMLEKDGVKIAILAYGRKSLFYHELAKGMGSNYWLDMDGMRADAKRAREAGADAVILCMHFGDEYTFSPSSYQKKLVQEMRAAGVTAVIGSHPHVLQPLVVDAGSKYFAAYSLGNLVTTQATGKRQYAAMMKLTVHKDLLTGEVTISKLSYVPTWTRMVVGADGKSHVRVYDIRQAIAACQAGTDPELKKKYLGELTKGYDWIKKMLGEEYLDPLPN